MRSVLNVIDSALELRCSSPSSSFAVNDPRDLSRQPRPLMVEEYVREQRQQQQAEQIQGNGVSSDIGTPCRHPPYSVVSVNNSCTATTTTTTTTTRSGSLSLAEFSDTFEENDDSIKMESGSRTTADSLCRDDSRDSCIIVNNSTRQNDQMSSPLVSTMALTPQKRIVNDLSAFTIDKLRWDLLKFHGRDREVEFLQQQLAALVQERDDDPNYDKSERSKLESSNAENEEQQPRKRQPQERLVLVSGPSGTGKSKLVDTVLKKAVRKHHQQHGLVVKGKFDLYHNSNRQQQQQLQQPFSGICRACSEVCGAILRLQQQRSLSSSTAERNTDASDTLYADKGKAQQICSALQSSLGVEAIGLLVRLLPALREIMLIPSSWTEPITTRTSLPSSEERKHQIQFAVLQFIRVTRQFFTPFVMVLDDLQWADTTSLELLEVVLNDRKSHDRINNKFMIIGIYRSDPKVLVEDNEMMHLKFIEFLQGLERKSDEGDFQFAQLELRDLDVPAVHQIIQDVLDCDGSNIDQSRTLALANICHEKSHGNPFFLRHYLEMLCYKQFLTYNLGTFAWTWNNAKIKSYTDVSDNVVEILKVKMKSFAPDLLNMLKIASFLGSYFEVEFLRLVWCELLENDGLVETSNDDSKFDYCLSQLETEGLIIQVLSESAHCRRQERWVHDEIHHAAMDLIPQSERADWSRRIGDILVTNLEGEKLASAIFLVVKLLNESDIHNCGTLPDVDETRVKWAKLNCQACAEAIRLSAFESAALYARKGISFLPEGCWGDHYHLTLNLYSLGAKAEGSIGNVLAMEQYCKAVLAQQDKPIEDKFDVYHTLTDGIVNANNVQIASDLLYDILGNFKCRFPKNTISVGIGVVGNVCRIKATIKSRDLSRLSTMEDTTRMELMRFLDKLASCCYILKDHRLPLVIFRTLNWTLKYGICDQSPTAFATTGMMMTGLLDDFKGGALCGQHALNLLEKAPSRATVSRTMMCVYAYIFSWTKPHQILIKPLLDAYDIGLQTGDTESATGSILNYMLLKLLSGSSLKTLEADLSLYSKQMKDLKRGPNLKSTKAMHQVVLNLLGRNNGDDPTHFIGDSMSQEDLKQARSETFWDAGVYFFQGVLFTYFGDHAQQADAMLRNGHDYIAKIHVAASPIMMDYCLKGVSCFAMARRTRKKKYAKFGILCRTRIKRWLDAGNPNVSRYDSLLEAEYMAYKGHNFAAIKHYEIAIMLAARGGFQQDAAFANERLGQYQIEVMKDVEEGIYRIGEAIKYWGCWGAAAKVHQLEERYFQ